MVFWELFGADGLRPQWHEVESARLVLLQSRADDVILGALIETSGSAANVMCIGV